MIFLGDTKTQEALGEVKTSHEGPTQTGGAARGWVGPCLSIRILKLALHGGILFFVKIQKKEKRMKALKKLKKFNIFI